MTFFTQLVEKVLNDSLTQIERDIISLSQKLDTLNKSSEEYIEVNRLLQKIRVRKQNNTRISVEGVWSNPTNPKETPQEIRQSLGTKIPALAVNFWAGKKHIVTPAKELNCGDIMYKSHDKVKETNQEKAGEGGLGWEGIQRRGGKNGWNYLTQDNKPTPHPRNAVKNQARVIRERENPSSSSILINQVNDSKRLAVKKGVVI